MADLPPPPPPPPEDYDLDDLLPPPPPPPPADYDDSLPPPPFSLPSVGHEDPPPPPELDYDFSDPRLSGIQVTRGEEELPLPPPPPLPTDTGRTNDLNQHNIYEDGRHKRKLFAHMFVSIWMPMSSLE